jgi:hypothetical protein
MSRLPSKVEGSAPVPRVVYLAIVLAAGSCLVSGYALIEARQPRPAPRAEAPPSSEAAEPRRNVDAARGDLGLAGAARLPERMAALEVEMARLRGLVAPRPEGAEAVGAGGGADAGTAPRASKPPRWTSFKPPSGAVTIQAVPGDGDPLVVTNTDPSLTGKRMRVEATAADGTVGHVSIIVPAPGQ